MFKPIEKMAIPSVLQASAVPALGPASVGGTGTPSVKKMMARLLPGRIVYGDVWNESRAVSSASAHIVPLSGLPL